MNRLKISDNDRQKARDLELRSEKLRDILGQVPGWVVRYGTLIICLVLVVLFLGSYLLRYPDIIPAKLVLTTERPPAQLIAKSSSKIDKILVDDKAWVDEGQVMVVLQSSADYEDVIRLDRLMGNRFDFDTLLAVHFPEKMNLGRVQEAYAVFQKGLQENRVFLEQDYHNKMIRFNEVKLGKSLDLLEVRSGEFEASRKVYQLARKDYERDSALFQQSPQSFSPAELEDSEREMLEKYRSFKSAQTQTATAELEVTDLEHKIIELRLEHDRTSMELRQQLQEAYEKLSGRLAEWEEQFLIRSPFDGNASFTQIWSESQNVNAGEVVVTVLPQEKGEIIGKAVLSVGGIGKIREHQKVIIRFDNYPYMEFGTLSGEVTSISLVPVEGTYAAEIRLDSGRLVTNYGVELDFQQNMQGMAEIITEERTLLERITDPFRSAAGRQRVLKD